LPTINSIPFQNSAERFCLVAKGDIIGGKATSNPVGMEKEVEGSKYVFIYGIRGRITGTMTLVAQSVDVR
jgi:hypothetical protein